MTIQEVKKKYCDDNGYIFCQECPCYPGCDDCTCNGTTDAYAHIIDKFGDIESEDDMINHPNHYCREDAMESIEEMVLIFGKEAVKNFCLCNVWKYRYRAANKNGEEDLRKSDWYIKKYQELCEN